MPARETHTGAPGRVATISHPVDWATLARPADHVAADLQGLYDEPNRPRGPGADSGYFRHAEHSAEFLIEVVKAHSVDYRTVDRLTAWGGEASQADRTDAGECRVLGWTSAAVLRWTLSRRLDSLNPVAAFRLLDQPEIAALDRSNRDYVVLVDNHAGGRMPAGAISARDIDLWRLSGQAELEGAFAVDADTYRRRFTRTRIAA